MAEHKKRNVLDQLPEKMRPSVKAWLNEAYRTGDAERARRPGRAGSRLE